jgi:alpha-glucosidase (family GH31 glycosyl hydrolase)
MPVVRPVAMVDPTYPNLDDQFMLGDQLMVAPVMAPQTNWRRVFIPATHDVWYDFWSGARIAGGHEAYCDAPLTVLPLYAKAGAAIPMWPPVQHTGELPADTLRLRVFAGSGQTEVYEDAGEGEPDPAGWSTIHTQLTPQAFELTWERQPGAKPAYKHIDITVLGLLWVPNTVSATIDGKPVKVGSVEGGMIKITGVPAFDMLRIEPGDPNKQ